MVNFVNTGIPYYDGLTFNNGTELLTLIRDNISWVIIQDNIPNDLIITGVTSNGHSCNIQLFNNNNTLDVAIYKNSSISDLLSLELTDGDVNKLWLVHDTDSAIITIKNRVLHSGAVYLGFLERFNSNDTEAYLIAKLTNKLNDVIVAKALFNGVDFRIIGADFAESDNFGSSILNGGYQGIWDLVTIPHAVFSNFNSGKSNAGYFAHTGQVNKVNDRPVTDRIFYLEGRGAINNYLSSGDNPEPLYNRGFLKHCAGGFGKEPPGKIILDTKGDRYLVSGGDGFQGVLIEQNPIASAEEKPVIIRKNITTLEIAGLISELRNSLKNIGWVVVSENSTSIVLSAQDPISLNFCYIRFSIFNSNVLQVEGEQNGNNLNVSPTLFLNLNSTNIITEIVSGQSAAVSFNNEQGIWFGFLRQEGTTGDPVWGFGTIKDGVNDTYIFVDNNWIAIADSFTIATDQTSSYPVQNQDSLTTASTPILFYDNPDSRNSAFQAYKGQINGATGKAQLKEFTIIAGGNSKIDYGSFAQGASNAPKLSYHGVVDYVCDGMRSLSGGETVTLESGAEFMSVGGTGWNGMQIA